MKTNVNKENETNKKKQKKVQPKPIPHAIQSYVPQTPFCIAVVGEENQPFFVKKALETNGNEILLTGQFIRSIIRDPKNILDMNQKLILNRKKKKKDRFKQYALQ